MAKEANQRAPRAPLEIPEFMKPDLGLGTENIRAESVAWPGEDGGFDADAALAAHGYDPVPPFEMILRAIIAGNPISASADEPESRFELAKTALLGAHRKRGRKVDDDYGLLMEIAWRYHVARLSSNKRVNLARMIRECVSELSARPPRTPSSWESVTRRLQDKFRNRKDLYLARATGQDNPERMADICAVARVLDALEKMGISSERTDALQPHRRT